MKRIRTLFFVLLTGHLLGGGLHAQVQAPSEEQSPHLLVFTNQVDFTTLTPAFRRQGLNSDQRAKKVLNLLQTQARHSQEQFYARYAARNAEFKVLHSHWIVNALVIEADAAFLADLRQDPLVFSLERTDQTSGKFIGHDPIPAKDSQVKKGPFSSEPGHFAIRANKMWSRGYSGEGTKVLLIDIYTFAYHPAIREQWLGWHQTLGNTYFEFGKVPMEASPQAGEHGVAVTSCALGLERATQDTSGVAPGARYTYAEFLQNMRSDDLTLLDLVPIFEWALNPDGDTSTTRDIPDVINNSYGFEEQADSAMCNGFFTQILYAIEAAGIANLWAAGNEGPQATTLRYPQSLALTEINPFAVGSVNPNTINYPISFFSSRGPSPCTASGSVLIKPEVTAPGDMIRCATGADLYNQQSGTSMACPYAAGACLLLKEAFPTVAGDEILEALYYSAQDLGVVGEDNDYGNGIINVNQAFLYLSANHSPVSPIDHTYDLAISGYVPLDSDVLCDPSVVLQVILENKGDSSLAVDSLRYGLYDAGLQSMAYPVTLSPGQRDTVSLPVLNLNFEGWKEYVCEAVPVAGIQETDTVNNRYFHRINVRGQRPYGFVETFETYSSFGPEWLRFNPDFQIFWDTVTTGGLPNSSRSIHMNISAYTGANNEPDELISPKLEVPASGPVFLNFDFAYQFRSNLRADTLLIHVSDDCGLSWQKVFGKGGAEITTTSSTSLNFYPARADQWEKKSVDLSAYAGSGSILLKFTTLNNVGNNLFLDNISLNDSSQMTASPEPEAPQASIWPNPGSESLNIAWEGHSTGEAIVSILDLSGKVLYEERHARASSNWSISTHDLPKGSYLVRISDGQQSLTQKWVKL